MLCGEEVTEHVKKINSPSILYSHVCVLLSVAVEIEMVIINFFPPALTVIQFKNNFLVVAFLCFRHRNTLYFNVKCRFTQGWS
jgi:hypothetical protein